MNKSIIFSSLIGAAIGSLATFFITKRYYKKIADEEIESVKHAFNETNYIQKKKNEEQPARPSKETTAEDEVTGSQLDIKAYAKMVQNNKNRNKYARQYQKNTVEETVDDSEDEPKESCRFVKYDEYYVCIDDEDYGEETLYLYEDGVLADEDDEVWIKERIEARLPKNWKEGFSLYDDDEDSMYVINDDFKMCYEILKSQKLYYGDVVAGDDD